MDQGAGGAVHARLERAGALDGGWPVLEDRTGATALDTDEAVLDEWAGAVELGLPDDGDGPAAGGSLRPEAIESPQPESRAAAMTTAAIREAKAGTQDHPRVADGADHRPVLGRVARPGSPHRADRPTRCWARGQPFQAAV